MRPGRTKTTSFSLDEKTLRNLKALAKRRHGGNVSALIAEFADREAKLLAAEAFLEKYGGPTLSDDEAAKLDAEWEAAIPRAPKRTVRKKRTRPKAA